MNIGLKVKMGLTVNIACEHGLKVNIASYKISLMFDLLSLILLNSFKYRNRISELRCLIRVSHALVYSLVSYS